MSREMGRGEQGWESEEGPGDGSQAKLHGMWLPRGTGRGPTRGEVKAVSQKDRDQGTQRPVVTAK